MSRCSTSVAVRACGWHFQVPHPGYHIRVGGVKPSERADVSGAFGDDMPMQDLESA